MQCVFAEPDAAAERGGRPDHGYWRGSSRILDAVRLTDIDDVEARGAAILRLVARDVRRSFADDDGAQLVELVHFGGSECAAGLDGAGRCSLLNANLRSTFLRAISA